MFNCSHNNSAHNPNITHNRSDPELHNSSHKSNYVPLTHTTRQFPLGQRGWTRHHSVTLGTTALLKHRRRTMSTVSAVDLRWPSPPSIMQPYSRRRALPQTTSIHQYPPIYQRRSLTLYIAFATVQTTMENRHVVPLPVTRARDFTRQWPVWGSLMIRRLGKVAGHPCRRAGWPLYLDTVCLTRHLQARQLSPSIADRCGLLAMTPPRRDDATTRMMSRASRRGGRRSSVTTQATVISEDQCRVDVHPIVNTAHKTLHTKQSAVHFIYTISYRPIHLGERGGTTPLPTRWDLQPPCWPFNCRLAPDEISNLLH